MVDGKVSMDGIWKVLGELVRSLVLQKLTTVVDAMQQIASDMNKMRRSLFINSVIMVWLC